MLWHLPTDLKFFKNITWGMPVIMGRKTFESVGKPLPGRQNIIITSNKQWSATGVQVVQNMDEALAAAKTSNTKEIFITGGGSVYKSSMNIADKIYMTRVHTAIEGDTFFPEINEAEWKLEQETVIDADEKNNYAMSFQTWIKRQ